MSNALYESISKRADYILEFEGDIFEGLRKKLLERCFEFAKKYQSDIIYYDPSVIKVRKKVTKRDLLLQERLNKGICYFSDLTSVNNKTESLLKAWINLDKSRSDYVPSIYCNGFNDCEVS